ncbi:MAG: hypothetical protein IT452_04340 [Planctomycetia bacterium]|nr:hypothetical protein [Planctomycetia bacterium]
MHRKGFTLFELVVLIVIALVGFALITPCFHTSRGGSRKTDCKNSLKQIGVYFALYESKFKAYPTPGAATWFAQLWQRDLATDGNLFRCAMRGKAAAGTHYNVLPASGAWVNPSGTTPGACTWGPTGLDDKTTPPDFPMACDGNDSAGVPNHGKGGDLNVLFFQGRVDVFAIGSPTETAVSSLLIPSSWAAPVGTR